MLSSLALAPTISCLWDELRGFCLQLGCPAMGFIDMTGCGRAAETVATTFAIHFCLDELRQDLAAAAGSAILIDNQTPETVARWCADARKASRPVFLEASGNMRLDSVRAYALAGVDAVSVGELTHSVRAADISLELAPQ